MPSAEKLCDGALSGFPCCGRFGAKVGGGTGVLGSTQIVSDGSEGYGRDVSAVDQK